MTSQIEGESWSGYGQVRLNLYTARSNFSRAVHKDATVVNLVIKDFTGRAYELTDRFGMPRASSAKPYRNDAYLTFRFVAALPLAPEQWMQILKSTHQRLPNFYSGHPAEVHQAVAQSIVRGDIIIYQLPSLNIHHCLPGNKGFGFSIIKGPNPHNATDFIPETINSVDVVQQLLAEAGISSQAFLGYLNSENLFDSEQSKSSYSDALQLIANGKLLIYKLPLPPRSSPVKTVEYVAASSADKPVSLGPENNKIPSATKTEALLTKKTPPQTLDEASQRLIDAGPAVRAAKENNKPLPPSSYSLADKQAVVEGGLEEKFLIRVIEETYAGDEGFIGQVRLHGQSISWTAPFSMVEHGDTDAEALLNAFGTRHDPKKTYTILIVDREKLSELGDVETIIPTKQNLKNLIAENPKISTLTPVEVEHVLSDELAPKYYVFAKEKAKQDISSKDIDEMRDLSEKMGFSESETDSLMLRQQLADQVAAWEEFTGNGMTLDTNSSASAYGPVEVVILDKKPMKLGKLRNDKVVKSVNC